MGAVFAAEQIATELPVAIKVLYPHILGSVDAIEKFTLESRIAARLNSDHIVRMYDGGYDEESQLPFLVMELLHGQDLQKVVEQNGPFPVEAVTTFIVQIARGLERAHTYVSRDGNKEPIVHRDLKPENLFLTRDEDGRKVVKILDFGMAKVIGEAGGVSRDIKGTPLFMAYEQASGEPVSPQTDIWALGLTTFYLLTGRNYWKTASSPRPELSSLFGEILSLPLAPPSARAKDLGLNWAFPLQFDHWFLKCLDRDPLMRFPSALRAASELEQALNTSARSLSDVMDPSIARTRAGGPHLGATQTSGKSSFPAFSKTLAHGTSTPGDPSQSDEIALPLRPRLRAPRWSRRTIAIIAIGSSALAYGASFLGDPQLSPKAQQAPGAHSLTQASASSPVRALTPLAPESTGPTEPSPSESPRVKTDRPASSPVPERGPRKTAGRSTRGSPTPPLELKVPAPSPADESAPPEDPVLFEPIATEPEATPTSPRAPDKASEPVDPYIAR